MAFLSDAALDGGPDYIVANGTRIDICSSEPTSYSQATTGGAVSLGNKTGLTLTKSDGNTNGRSADIPAINDGSVTNTGTATHWALTNGTNTLIATGSLSASQSVTASNTFTLGTFEINFADAVSQ